jgi:type I restriction enzyme, R subunit
MSYNESETRFFLIDPVLRQKGYDDPLRLKLETPAPVEPTGFKGRRRPGAGRTDYLLCVQVGQTPKPLPVAVIEAKAEAEDPLRGMQQAKGYADCKRFSVQYVFATNGHRYGEFDLGTQLPSGPHDLKRDFPTHTELTVRYAKDTGVDPVLPASDVLFMADSAAYSKPRYYQDAAIRAALEKILLCEQSNTPARVLLSLATGSGKTVLAANLLWRLHEAGRLVKPALFLCDRDELRSQALEKISRAFPKGAVRIVETVRGKNAATNAKVHIATYHTLGLDDGDQDYASFLTEHYPPDSFSVIVIDECHRSAWGRWSVVLQRNPNAAQIGLTATPRSLHDSERQTPEDGEIAANNLKYFGAALGCALGLRSSGLASGYHAERRRADAQRRDCWTRNRDRAHCHRARSSASQRVGGIVRHTCAGCALILPGDIVAEYSRRSRAALRRLAPR